MAFRPDLNADCLNQRFSISSCPRTRRRWSSPATCCLHHATRWSPARTASRARHHASARRSAPCSRRRRPSSPSSADPVSACERVPARRTATGPSRGCARPSRAPGSNRSRPILRSCESTDAGGVPVNIAVRSVCWPAGGPGCCCARATQLLSTAITMASHSAGPTRRRSLPQLFMMLGLLLPRVAVRVHDAWQITRAATSALRARPPRPSTPASRAWHGSGRRSSCPTPVARRTRPWRPRCRPGPSGSSPA